MLELQPAFYRYALVDHEKHLCFSFNQEHKMAWRASQAVSRESEATLILPEKSATLAHALDGNLTTKPAISGQK